MEVSLLPEEPDNRRTLETVKVLHDTVLALRAALEDSRKELLQLREKTLVRSKKVSGDVRKTFRIIKTRDPGIIDSMDDKKDEEGDRRRRGTEGSDGEFHDRYKVDSEPESDDIDDIELVFTTGETDPNSVHEDLVPILEETKGKRPIRTSIIGADISKCGISEESDSFFAARRNTLPNPSPYQPMIHRELFAGSRRAPMQSPCKVLLGGTTQETSAQTDITALPAQWKSETYLAHKMNCNLTTLPSKFALPVPQPKRLPLSDKTCEARRVLLSDINFTSMVPELSRSADHLHEDKRVAKSQPCAYECFKSHKTDRCCDYVRQESRSSCGSYYGSRCQISSISIPPFVCEEIRRRHSWKPAHVYCCRAKHFFWSSVPSSPIRCAHDPYGESSENFSYFQPGRRRKAKVHFYHCDPLGQSMPNLRLEGESGESTDSLLDETEEFLRRSIDKLLLGSNRLRKKERRLSDADSVSGFEPAKSAQPFLPKTIKDLQRDCIVKVISPDGKVVTGRLKYSGMVPGRIEPYVGVELASDVGFSDGTFMGHRFFDCEPSHAIFVPFKKVVIAWSA